MVFIGREYSGMVEAERELKRTGVTDAGTIRSTRATAGADFRLVGRITSADAVDSSSATASRYQQISFEMIDLRSESTRLNSSHVRISYAVFCLKKKKKIDKAW